MMMSSIDSIQKAFLCGKGVTRLQPGDVFVWFHREEQIALTRGEESLRWRADDSQDYLEVPFIQNEQDFKLFVSAIAWSHGLTVEWADEDTESHSYRVIEAPRV